MEKRKYKRKVITGTVIYIEEKELPSGTLKVEARVRDNETLYVCTFWDALAHKLVAALLLNKKIHVEGYLNDEGTITAKFFDSPEMSRGPAPKITEEDRLSVARYHALRDMVLVPITISGNRIVMVARKKTDCVKVNGEWVEKLEYCNDSMGAGAVTEQFRDFHDDGTPGSLNVDPVVVRERIDAMVKHVARKQGDYIDE